MHAQNCLMAFREEFLKTVWERVSQSVWSACVESSDWLLFCARSVSHVQLFATPWTATWQASLFFTISQSLLKLMSIESVVLSNHLIFCSPFFLLPSIFLNIRVFHWMVSHIWWPKYWSFSISPSSEYSGSISFRIDWFDLLAVQRTLIWLVDAKVTKWCFGNFNHQPSADLGPTCWWSACS